MNTTIKIIAVLTILFSLTTAASAGGGWPQKKGKGYFKLSEWWIISNQHYTNTGQIDPNVTSGIFNTSAYFEYGITDRLTVTGYVPFFSRSYNNNIISLTSGETLFEGESINSFGDTDLGLQYGLTQGKINTSLSLVFGIPFGNSAGGSQGNLQTGDGEFNQMLRLDAGIGFKLAGQNAYANTYVAYNNRTQGFADEYRFGVESGVNLLNNKLLALVRVFGVLSAHNGNTTLDTGTSIFANNAEHISISPELNYNIGQDWGVSASVSTAVYGRLIFASPSYSVGVYTKF